jgi:hypothetical protein
MPLGWGQIANAFSKRLLRLCCGKERLRKELQTRPN